MRAHIVAVQARSLVASEAQEENGAAASAPVYLATFGAALRKSRWGTLGGIVLSMTLMLHFFERMVRLYDEQAPTARAERLGLRAGRQPRRGRQ